MYIFLNSEVIFKFDATLIRSSHEKKSLKMFLSEKNVSDLEFKYFFIKIFYYTKNIFYGHQLYGPVGCPPWATARIDGQVDKMWYKN